MKLPISSTTNTNEIYLDNAATTFLDPQVSATMARFWSNQLGNPSSLHKSGVRAATQIESARTIVAKEIHAQADEIYFTSGGTEANNLAIFGLCRIADQKKRHIIISAIEHPSVLEPARILASQDFEVTVLMPDHEGLIHPETLKNAIRTDTLLVSVMHANSEIGTIQPTTELGAICRHYGAFFHVDAVQSFLKEPINVTQQNLDLLTVSAHKVHGPRGVGALFIRRGIKLQSIFYGGGQESGMRPGTQNTDGIIGFSAAIEAWSPQSCTVMRTLRDKLIIELKRLIPEMRINGSLVKRLCNNINLSIPGLRAKDLLFLLNRSGIYISAGSACSAGRKTPSHVLIALGQDDISASEALRISLSKWTTDNEIDAFIECFLESIAILRRDLEPKVRH